MAGLLFAIIIVSDTCATNASSDKTGPALAAEIDRALGGKCIIEYVPDEVISIRKTVTNCVSENVNAIFTAGGTGFGVRDVTPEAINPLIERDAPGLVAAMLVASLKITPYAAVARPIAGTIGSTLVVTFPGSPKGAVENLRSIGEVLPHCLSLLNGDDSRYLHADIPQRGTDSAAIGSKSPTHPHSHPHSRPHSHVHYHAHTHDNAHSQSQSHSHTHTHPHSNTDASLEQHSGPTFFGPASRNRQSPYPMIPFDDAVGIIIKNAPEPKRGAYSLQDSLGCALSEDVFAPQSLPPFRASIVDGYAVHHSDFDGHSDKLMRLSNIALAAADIGTLELGTCVRITTGAPLPNGATAVIPVENTEVSQEENGEEVELRIHASGVKFGDNVREIGSDVEMGSLVLSRNTLISALGGEIGMLASLGITKVPTYLKPKVGVMSTGDEVVDPWVSLSGTHIRDANRPMLKTILRSWLGREHVFDFGIVKDDFSLLKERISKALTEVDVLVTSGGVSMGELDLLKPLIKHLGGEIKFGRVAMKPGKPVTFATLPNGKFIFALPGNPVSCVVCLYLFAYPLLNKMQGRTDGDDDWVDVELSHDVVLDPRPEFQRGIATRNEAGKLMWENTGFQRSSRIGSMVRANSLVRLPGATDRLASLPKGSSVRALMIGTDCLTMH